MKYEKALQLVACEVTQASAKFAAFNSVHEGYAVILEELDELWQEIKKQKEARSKLALRREAIHVAAMAVRFLIDCCDEA